MNFCRSRVLRKAANEASTVAGVKAKKLTLTQRVAKLERANRKLRAECKQAADTAECATVHAARLAAHVARLLREKETLVIRLTNGTGPLPPELQR